MTATTTNVAIDSAAGPGVPSATAVAAPRLSVHINELDGVAGAGLDGHIDVAQPGGWMPLSKRPAARPPKKKVFSLAMAPDSDSALTVQAVPDDAVPVQAVLEGAATVKPRKKVVTLLSLTFSQYLGIT